MAMAMMRFNWVLPGTDPQTMSGMYRAALDMASYGEEHGFIACTLEEHHGAENGWSPTPLLMAGMILSRTQNMNVMIMALLVPLHDPLRIAEDIAVLDLASGGRLNVVGGLGYIPAEYARHGSTPDVLMLQVRAFGANPMDAEVAGNLAFLLLRQRPAQAEAARQLALHALTLRNTRQADARIEDWATFAIASALTVPRSRPSAAGTRRTPIAGRRATTARSAASPRPARAAARRKARRRRAPPCIGVRDWVRARA